jgi:hypothetical protein
MLRLISCIFVTIVCPFSWSQQSIEFTLDSDTLNEKYTIETLRFYVSSVEITYHDGTKFQEKNSVHLIDLEDANSWKWNLLDSKDADVKFVSFLLGTDSLTNVSGILEGDLDPIKGMYWAWNSGYINFKVEGFKREENSPFEFHIGGYLPPYQTVQRIELPVNTINQPMRIRLNLSQFLDQINLNEVREVMIPGPDAAALARQLSNCFTLE